ncbi:hypothetical protein EYC80_002374 [Monilinia laxa]|uniref:Uncharacterized protein n=1 Tax=Monilinia laxa TaxID=61186 RepID=A0A5N6K3V2_MONLA|nr:hypothetical protein EYC80_002374 [Monilinia laxa]
MVRFPEAVKIKSIPLQRWGVSIKDNVRPHDDNDDTSVDAGMECIIPRLKYPAKMMLFLDYGRMPYRSCKSTYAFLSCLINNTGLGNSRRYKWEKKVQGPVIVGELN